MPPLYSDRAPRRLFPKAASCANGEDALLLTLPLIRNPSAASADRSPPESPATTGASFGRVSAAAAADPAGGAVTAPRSEPPPEFRPAAGPVRFAPAPP